MGGALDAEDLRRKKRQKLALYIVIFIVFQIGVITVFSLTVMKVKTPKFRVRSATFDTTFDVTNSSFNLKMDANLGVKNTNWGPYKYKNTTVFFYYKGQQVGSATINKSKANLRSTKKFIVPVELSSGNIAANSDISSGVLPLTSSATMNGKVTLMLIMKKKKNIQMNCTMEVNISTQSLQNVKCK